MKNYFNLRTTKHELKKIVSIGLLVLFSFNLGGYYLLFWVLRDQAGKQLSSGFDAAQNMEGTFEIKIPVTLPYPLQENDFQRIDGEFVYKNEHYRLFEQKHENDTLVIVCVKDKKANQLAQAMNEFSSKSSDDQNSTGTQFASKVLNEYVSSNLLVIGGVNGWYQKLDAVFIAEGIHSVCLTSPSPPPKS